MSCDPFLRATGAHHHITAAPHLKDFLRDEPLRAESRQSEQHRRDWRLPKLQLQYWSTSRIAAPVAHTMRLSRTHAVAWRPVCALALAAVLCLAPLHTASSLLDADGPLAVTGCVAVMETLFTMVHNPPEEVCFTAAHTTGTATLTPLTALFDLL